MATIERVINERRWTVSPDGCVGMDGVAIFENQRLCSESRLRIDTLKTAITLYEEWRALKAQEDLDAPPRVELPEGMKWQRTFAVTGNEWVLEFSNSTWIPVPLKGNDRYEAYRKCIAAADELASRRPAAEHETRGSK